MTRKIPAGFAARHAENMARCNSDHMAPSEIETLPQKIMRGLCLFLMAFLVVMIVAFALAQI